jgi:DNA-binding NarL/FixJ family response regulator
VRQEAPPTSQTANQHDPRISVVIVDDDGSFRTALSELLASHGIDVVGTASDGETALANVQASAPDVVLMDVGMPGLSGVDTTRKLVSAAPDSAVLMLTSSDDAADVVAAMVAGACGYVLKGTSPESLVANIRAAAGGDCVMSALIASQVFRALTNQQAWVDAPASVVNSPASVVSLSKREREILTMVADGKQNSEIATALVLSPYTVRNHISRLLRKLQVHNRAEAAGYAARHGLHLRPGPDGSS